jgi:hypothetical protein
MPHPFKRCTSYDQEALWAHNVKGGLHLSKDIELENEVEQVEQAEQARQAIRYNSNENVETNLVIQRINGASRNCWMCKSC